MWTLLSMAVLVAPLFKFFVFYFFVFFITYSFFSHCYIIVSNVHICFFFFQISSIIPSLCQFKLFHSLHSTNNFIIYYFLFYYLLFIILFYFFIYFLIFYLICLK